MGFILIILVEFRLLRLSLWALKCVLVSLKSLERQGVFIVFIDFIPPEWFSFSHIS